VRITSVRRALYTGAKALGDVQVIQKAAERRSVAPLAKRAERRLLGRLLSWLIP
jgi:hypothetical protein